MLSEEGNEFYAESSEFHGKFPDDFSFCFNSPSSGEDEHWMWSKSNDVELRGNRAEIAKNIKDWFYSLSNGPLSWVDYSESAGGPGYRNIRPAIDLSSYFLYFETFKEFELFYNIWEGQQFPLSSPPRILERVQDHKNIPNLCSFINSYHSINLSNAFAYCNVMKSYVSTIEKIIPYSDIQIIDILLCYGEKNANRSRDI
jgi:hypothetical protein